MTPALQGLGGAPRLLPRPGLGHPGHEADAQRLTTRRPLLPLSWGSPQPAARTGSPAVGSAHREPTQRRDGGSGWPHTRSPSNAATRPAPCPDSHTAPGPGGRLTRCDGDDPVTPSRKGPARSFLGSCGPEGTASLPGGPGLWVGAGDGTLLGASSLALHPESFSTQEPHLQERS